MPLIETVTIGALSPLLRWWILDMFTKELPLIFLNLGIRFTKSFCYTLGVLTLPWSKFFAEDYPSAALLAYFNNLLADLRKNLAYDKINWKKYFSWCGVNILIDHKLWSKYFNKMLKFFRMSTKNHFSIFYNSAIYYINLIFFSFIHFNH